jgi:hypothetical protein
LLQNEAEENKASPIFVLIKERDSYIPNKVNKPKYTNFYTKLKFLSIRHIPNPIGNLSISFSV